MRECGPRHDAILINNLNQNEVRKRSKLRCAGPTSNDDRLLVIKMIGAEGGSRTRTSLRTTDFKPAGDGITWSYQTIRTSIYRPSGRQSIALSGFVSTRRATILAPSSIAFNAGNSDRVPQNPGYDSNAQYASPLPPAPIFETIR
jgi:hypothetical protein